VHLAGVRGFKLNPVLRSYLFLGHSEPKQITADQLIVTDGEKTKRRRYRTLRHLTQRDITEIVAAAESGIPLTRLARYYKISERGVRRLVKERNEKDAA